MSLLTRHPLLRRGVCAAVAAALLLPQAPALAATTALADLPVFANNQVPGNLALPLSVEYPTATRVAHIGAYSSDKRFLGFFDPEKCYSYRADAAPQQRPANVTGGGTALGISPDKGDTGHFFPVSKTANRTCSGNWSGNFLNWASMATIDPFAWAMTGGRRVVDEVGTTIVEKAWNEYLRESSEDLFPTRSQDTSVSEGYIARAQIAGATPFAAAQNLSIRVKQQGYAMQLTTEPGFTARFYEYTPYVPPDPNTTFLGPAKATVQNDRADHNWGRASPAPGVSVDFFAAEYVGNFIAPESGNYTFTLSADDGAEIWVDPSGTGRFDNTTKLAKASYWARQNVTARTSDPVPLTGNRRFSVRIRYFDWAGGAEMHLLWKRPTATGNSAFNASETLNYTVRAKVCDPAVGVEPNCVNYGNNNWKPEGLIQRYSQDMRFSVFGYLNHSIQKRDGGVLRARQKFVGPTVPGSPVANPVREWSSDGTMVRNPDAADALQTTTNTGVAIADSGVINYLHGFGQIVPGDYKGFDPVNELYYAALRYFSGQQNVPQWSDIPAATDAATRRKWVDGFPVITDWQSTDRARQPIQYSCQRNFVLGIGDKNTHADKNVPGATVTDAYEPPKPQAVVDDKLFDTVEATRRAKVLQGIPADPHADDSFTQWTNTYSPAYMAGLAFQANTSDILTDNAALPQSIGKQTVQTYWVDVLARPFDINNKFYLAAKFGGLDTSKLPAGRDWKTLLAGEIPEDAWTSSGDTLTDAGRRVTAKRPDNYFTGGTPDTMVAGLEQAFRSIANAVDQYGTAFSFSSPELTQTDNASYASRYEVGGWSGYVLGNSLSFDAAGQASTQQRWSTETTLESQLGGSTGRGWDTNRRVATFGAGRGVPFRYANLSSDQQTLLDTSYVSGNDGSDYLNWLRGDRSKEQTSYRQREVRLGDIVNSKLTVVGPPAARFSEAVNPGYGAFRRKHTPTPTQSGRPTVVYVGANDGMMHAFNGALTGAAAGREMFAYVPSLLFAKPDPAYVPSRASINDGLLARLGSPLYDRDRSAHHFYVDATPLTFDIDFNRTLGSATKTTTAASADWRTVLIGGLGKGGKGFYALDVSDPGAMTDETKLAAKVLWEFTDADMGYSYGAPLVVKTARHGWVAIFTSGYNSSNAQGHLFVVNPRTGALIQKIPTAGNASGLTHASAYVRDFTDGTADAVYVGDLDGQVWRFDLTGDSSTSTRYPDGVMLAKLTDTVGKAQPVTSAPLVEIHPKTRKRYVMVGTGRLLDASDIQSADPQSFYAIIDGTHAAFGTGISSGATTTTGATVTRPATRADLQSVDPTQGTTLGQNGLGWYIDFGVDGSSAWRMVAPGTSYNGVVAFPALNASGDVCAPGGTGRVYALDFDGGKTILTNGDPYYSVATSVADLHFISKDGEVRLQVGGSDGTLPSPDITLPDLEGLRLLNWREVPTVD